MLLKRILVPFYHSLGELAVTKAFFKHNFEHSTNTQVMKHIQSWITSPNILPKSTKVFCNTSLVDLTVK